MTNQYLARVSCLVFFCFSALPRVDAFHLKKVFVWVPEFMFPGVQIQCPNSECDHHPASSDGWIAKQPRRVFLDDDIGYLIGFRCVHIVHFTSGCTLYVRALIWSIPQASCACCT